MFAGSNNATVVKNTTHKVVLPFYLYAALSFLAATLFLFFSDAAFTQQYFHPHTLAITHIMALGWGTMIILGASHQLLPVLAEGSLYSVRLAFSSFILAAVGTPLLVYGFYLFDMGWPAKWGGRLVLLSVLCFIINAAGSIKKGNSGNVHVIFILTASFWLFITAFLGLALVYNFQFPFLHKESLDYLPLHAHTGIVGWFLLLVIGVGSRLIPMFLISKYTNKKLLWGIYFFINIGLINFLIHFLFFHDSNLFLISVFPVFAGISLFAYYCLNCYRQRIRKQVDEQMKISLLSVLLMLVPVVILIIVTGWLLSERLNERMVLIYGFAIFFGWITAIILGMTFKTLPFIVWNKVYHQRAGLYKTPNPKDLFHHRAFSFMALSYLAGFILFIAGIYKAETLMLNIAALLLVLAAVLYNFNVIKLLLHKPEQA